MVQIGDDFLAGSYTTKKIMERPFIVCSSPPALGGFSVSCVYVTFSYILSKVNKQ